MVKIIENKLFLRNISNGYLCRIIYAHVKSHNLLTRCVRNNLVAILSTSCNNAVILSSCLQGCHPQLVDKLLNCRTITSRCWKNLWQVCWAQQPCSKLPTSRWQLVNKLGTSSANTSCWQVVGTALLINLLAAGLLQLMKCLRVYSIYLFYCSQWILIFTIIQDLIHGNNSNFKTVNKISYQSHIPWSSMIKKLTFS
jgi:hypothetical protein